MDTVDVSSLRSAGDYLRADFLGQPVFLCRVVAEDRDVPHGVSLGSGEAIVSFSTKCTHMSCRLVNAEQGRLPVFTEGGTRHVLCGCPCHHSSFDLTRRGLPVNAPATACLPQVKLEAVRDQQGEVTRVKLLEWDRTNAVPYGVAYGATAQS